MAFLLFLFSVILFFFSCKNFQDSDTAATDVVARIYDRNLYSTDLDGLVPPGASPRDSLNILRNYINSWLRQQAVLYLAEKNLDAEQKNVERQLQEYRNSLIRYIYERDFTNQRLDTIVSDEEIEQFYKDNPANFQLRSNIIKVIYLKVHHKSPKLDKVREWYKSDNPKDRRLLEEYCHQYAINFFLDDQTWLLFDDLIKEIPIKTYDQEQFLQNNRSMEIQDSASINFVSIKGFRIKNNLSPLSFERTNIRTMIINQRKLKLIEELEKNAFADAEKSGAVEIFTVEEK